MLPLTLLAAAAADCPPPAHDPYVLRDAQVWDAAGPRRAEVVVIRGDRIEHVGDARPEDAALEVIELGGATVMPGLIDAHVHLASAPGQAWRTGDDRDALLDAHLRAYVASGVTTVLDTGISAADAARVRTRAACGPSPDVHLLPLVAPRGGYPSAVVPGHETVFRADEVGAVLDRVAALEPDGVKTTIEPGPILPVWPVHRPDVRAAFAEEAAARGLDVYVHAMSASAGRKALDLRPHALVHVPAGAGRRLTEALRDTYVMTTLVVYEIPVREGGSLHPGAEWLVPDVELATALDPGLQARSELAAARALLPRSPGCAVRTAARLTDAFTRGKLKRTGRTLLRLHEAGVPLVVGSDSGNWPLFLGFFHGLSTLRELELLEALGLPPHDILTAATDTPARMLGLRDVGRVAPGFRADLLILDRDPLQELQTLRKPRLIVRAGEARGPRSWVIGDRMRAD